MESQRMYKESFLPLQIIAALAIIILMPLSVYHGVVLFVKEPKEVLLIQDKNFHANISEEDKGKLDSWHEMWRLLFLKVSLIVGLFGIAFGVYTAIAALGTSLVLGSLATIFDAYLVAWNYLSDKIIFISLLLAVLLLGGALYWYSRKK